MCWHEIVPPNANGVPHHVAMVRWFLKDNDIDIEDISLSEITPMQRRYDPGCPVSYFANIERTDVILAATRHAGRSTATPNFGGIQVLIHKPSTT